MGRATAQTLIKAIGEVQTVAGAHFVDRPALLGFLDEMIAAPVVDEALRIRLAKCRAAPRPKSLRVSLPKDLRHAMMPELPQNITIEPSRLEVRAGTAVAMLESLVTLAMVMQNDLDRFQTAIEPPPPVPADVDEGLRSLLAQLRSR